MKKKYLIKRVEEPQKLDDINWEQIPRLEIECFPWDENGYKPRTEAAVCYSSTHFHIFFKTYEEQPHARYSMMNDPVYKDSCVEFFFRPLIGNDERYLNFEMNSLGALLLEIGTGRHERSHIPDVGLEDFRILTEKQASFWTVQYSIPFSFLRNLYGLMTFESGMVMEGNFYKCGDETRYPHYGCWNPIELKTPDFHCPEFFACLILE